jgi:Do/DeqQ family serine protease
MKHWIKSSALALTAVLTLTAAGQAQAQSRAVPQSSAEIQLSFSPLVKRVAPAVVNIFTRTTVRERRASPLFDDPFFRRFFGDRFPGGAQERSESSLGSGVIVSGDGMVVTNMHVIEGADEIRVVLNDRREFAAEVVQADERSDLAVLRIDPEGQGLPVAELGPSEKIEVGDLVLAIGNPFGVGQTVTSGIVSALARSRPGLTDFGVFIQTDAAINPGNSGGALVDMQGRVIGVNTAIYSRSGGSMGIGFAIPSSLVRRMVEAARTGGRVVRPWLGAQGQEVTADIAGAIGLSPPSGVLLDSVDPAGPLARAGIRQGDVVLAIDGRMIRDPVELRFRISTKQIGDQSEIEFWRHGRPFSASIRLEAPPETVPRDQVTLNTGSPLDGVEVANLSPAVKEEYGLNVEGDGVVVLDVKGRSFARRLGLRPGDVIVEVNDASVASVRDLLEIAGKRLRRWRFVVRRGDKMHVLNVS